MDFTPYHNLHNTPLPMDRLLDSQDLSFIPGWDVADRLGDLSLDLSGSSSTPPPQLASSSSPGQDTASVIRSDPNNTLPPFNIERQGDSAIDWFMYYDFIVTKLEAYYQLQPGYLCTDKYPRKINSERITLSNGEKRHPCGVLNCKAKPFTRHYDLERHFSTIHRDIQGQGSQEQRGKDHKDGKNSEKGNVNCDYKKCPHTAAFRKDHCREHFREFHFEDLIKRGPLKSSKTKSGKKEPQSVEEFMDSRIQNLNLSWWRCAKCLQRVPLDPNNYTCPTCRQTCESERVHYRELERKRAASRVGYGVRAGTAKSTLASSTSLTDYWEGCGQCENTWVPDGNDEGPCVACQSCRPGFEETVRILLDGTGTRNIEG